MVAVGSQTGTTNQGQDAVAIGRVAGQNSQGINSVAIGYSAGQTNQGAFGIAIGYGAGQTNQHANSIILNASGTALNSSTSSSFYAKPIRNEYNVKVLLYNENNGEITCYDHNIENLKWERIDLIPDVNKYIRPTTRVDAYRRDDEERFIVRCSNANTNGAYDPSSVFTRKRFNDLYDT